MEERIRELEERVEMLEAKQMINAGLFDTLGKFMDKQNDINKKSLTNIQTLAEAFQDFVNIFTETESTGN